MSDPETGARRWPAAVVARLLSVSRQALYHRPAVEPGGGRGASRAMGRSSSAAERCAGDLPRFGTRRVTAMVRRRLGGSGAARGVVNRKRVRRVMREHGLLVPQKRIPRGEHRGKINTERSDRYGRRT